MSVRREWTPETDAKIRELRLARQTWDQIALALGLARNTVLEHGRRIGVKRGRLAPQPAKVDQQEEDGERVAFRSGSPETWDLINRGLSIEGCRYAPDGKL